MRKSSESWEKEPFFRFDKIVKTHYAFWERILPRARFWNRSEKHYLTKNKIFGFWREIICWEKQFLNFKKWETVANVYRRTMTKKDWLEMTQTQACYYFSNGLVLEFACMRIFVFNIRENINLSKKYFFGLILVDFGVTDTFTGLLVVEQKVLDALELLFYDL